MRSVVIANLLFAMCMSAAQASTDDATAPPAKCTSAAPMRGGKPIADEPLADSLEKVALAGLAASSIRSTDPEPIWCLESTPTVSNRPLQVFRNTGSQGGFTPVQRVRVGGQPPRDFYVTLSGPALMILIMQGDATHRSWHPHVLYRQDGNETAVYAMFDEEPDTATITAMVADILSGKLQPAAVCTLRKVDNGYGCEEPLSLAPDASPTNP